MQPFEVPAQAHRILFMRHPESVANTQRFLAAEETLSSPSMALNSENTPFARLLHFIQIEFGPLLYLAVKTWPRWPQPSLVFPAR